MKNKLSVIYRKLYSCFGAQKWWPANTPFEVMIGAILTQNTSWKNVEKAIENLKDAKLLSAKKLHSLSSVELAKLIRPSGYYNIKTKRVKEFLRFFFRYYGGSLERMRKSQTSRLRKELLSVKGVGPETADSILLYALGKPSFVVDAYTKRILSRLGLIEAGSSYENVRNLFMQNLKNKVKLFNEFHALLVKLGKEYCLKNKPKCENCPLK